MEGWKKRTQITKGNKDDERRDLKVIVEELEK